MKLLTTRHITGFSSRPASSLSRNRRQAEAAHPAAVFADGRLWPGCLFVRLPPTAAIVTADQLLSGRGRRRVADGRLVLRAAPRGERTDNGRRVCGRRADWARCAPVCWCRTEVDRPVFGRGRSAATCINSAQSQSPWAVPAPPTAQPSSSSTEPRAATEAAKTERIGGRALLVETRRAPCQQRERGEGERERERGEGGRWNDMARDTALRTTDDGP